MRTQIKATTEFTTWLDQLKDLAGRARIQARLQRLALGNAGRLRSLKFGVAELKVHAGPGYRIYFTSRPGPSIVLLCGGDKSTQAKDIRLAYKLARGLEANDEDQST